MQFLFSLVALFLMGSLLYGLYAGVRTLVLGATRLTPNQATQEPTPARPRPQTNQSTRSQHGIDDLQALFALHQRGALTRDEFDQFKKHILSCITSAAHPITKEKT